MPSLKFMLPLRRAPELRLGRHARLTWHTCADQKTVYKYSHCPCPCAIALLPHAPRVPLDQYRDRHLALDVVVPSCAREAHQLARVHMWTARFDHISLTYSAIEFAYDDMDQKATPRETGRHTSSNTEHAADRRASRHAAIHLYHKH